MAKLIITADWHLRLTAPRSRIDDFYGGQLKKVEWILQRAIKEEAAIIIAGDICDKPNSGFRLVFDCIELFKKYNVEIFGILGNHDIQNHRLSSWTNTSLGLFQVADTIKLLNKEPLKYKKVNLYGMHWGESLIEQVENKDEYNLCVLHDMIIDSEKLYDGQEKAIVGHTLLQDTPFSFFATGHNHQQILCEENNKILCNPGSISRMNTTQLDFQPKIGLIDTDIQSFEWIDIPVPKSSDVFDIDNIQTDKQTEIDMEDFIIELKKKGIPQTRKYEKEIALCIKYGNYSDEIVDIINEAMREK